MKVLAEATYESDTFDKDDMPQIKKDLVYILHFGVTYQIVYTDGGGAMPANYTVAICQDVQTGQIRNFLPEQLKILGEDISKLKTVK